MVKLSPLHCSIILTLQHFINIFTTKAFGQIEPILTLQPYINIFAPKAFGHIEPAVFSQFGQLLREYLNWLKIDRTNLL